MVVNRWINPGVARRAYTAGVDGIRSTLDRYLDEQRRIVPADPRPGTGNIFVETQRKITPCKFPMVLGSYEDSKYGWRGRKGDFL